jgi:CubicO group peptidase (beta-lactamase class C family)
MKNSLCLAAVLLAGLTSAAEQCPADSNFPSENWPVQLVGDEKSSATKALEEYMFNLVGADADRKGIRSDGLVIIKDGKLIYEKYGRGYDETKRHISWSVAKSITSMLAGVAVQRQILSLDDSICKWLPQYSGQGVCKIALKHALTFSTGLGWQEGYENSSYQTSSVISMLFGAGHQDQLKHILTHKQAFEPGTHWSYSTGDAELASAVVKRAMVQKLGKNAFWDTLFDVLQMPRVAFEEDGFGTPLGGSMVFATPRDYARLGYLMLKDGCWKGARLLPVGYVDSSVKPSEPFLNSADATELSAGGYSWWLNRSLPTQNKGKPWKDIPEDVFVAIGHWGQYVAVVPSANVIIVRVGDDRTSELSLNKMIQLALEVAK